MKLKYFLALILSCSNMAGATFKGMEEAIENCDLEEFERNMARTPVRFAEYAEYRENLEPGAEGPIFMNERGFEACHKIVLQKAFHKLRDVDDDYFEEGSNGESKLAFEEARAKKQENLFKMITTFSKRVLEDPFRESCEPFILERMLCQSSVGLFSSFRRDPDLNQFIKDNANVLYLNAMRADCPDFLGIFSILKKKYGAVFSADNERREAFYGEGNVSGAFLKAFPPAAYRPWEKRLRYTLEDLEGLCQDFVFLYEDFIKGVGRRTRSLQDESRVERILEGFLSIPLRSLLIFADGSPIESEDFLRIEFDNNSPKKSKVQKKSVAERFGGLNLPILLEYVGYPEEPRLYTVPLQQMADTLKETHFDLFKRYSEGSLGALKSKVDFLNNLVLERDANLEEEVSKKDQLCRNVFFPIGIKECLAEKLVKNFLISRRKYPEFFERNLEKLEKFYNNLSRDLQEGPGSKMEEERWGKTFRMEEE